MGGKVSNDCSILISFYKWGSRGPMERQDNLIWPTQLIRRRGTRVSWFPVSYYFYHAPVFPFGINGTKWINYEKPKDSWPSQRAGTVCERPAERKCLSKYNILWNVILPAELLYCDLGWEPTTLKDTSQEDKNWGEDKERFRTCIGWGTGSHSGLLVEL